MYSLVEFYQIKKYQLTYLLELGKSLEKCQEKKCHSRNQSQFLLRKCSHNIRYLELTVFVKSLNFTEVIT